MKESKTEPSGKLNFFHVRTIFLVSEKEPVCEMQHSHSVQKMSPKLYSLMLRRLPTPLHRP